jgi:hypothetical protein
VGAVTMGPWSGSDSLPGTAISASADHLSAQDPQTGVKADAALQSNTWGTLVSFDVSDIKGPRTCQLVAVRQNGDTEVLSSWNVPKQGYGADAKASKLQLQASTALDRKDIAALRVQNVSADGETSTLVTIPTP